MLSLKIIGETPKTGKPLCVSCKHAKVVKGQNGQEFTHCGADIFAYSKGVIPWPVYACSGYHPTNMPWLHEMEEMAWKIEARRRGAKGFEQPDEREMEVTIKPPSNRYSSPDSE